MKNYSSPLIKGASEIEKMRRASMISSQLHLLGMSHNIENHSESSLRAYYQELRKQTEAAAWAYPPIVGSGERSTILHAKPTKRLLRDGELVLVDMGVKYENYCSDITRTWPVGKRFSKEQKTIYQIVLKAQKEVIKSIRPGTSLDELHEIARQQLLDGLLSKGILKSKKLERYFPHKTSHWIGQGVHDKCPYQYIDKSPVSLSAGMCFTVEPGLYFKGTNSKYEGIGVRIEDVALVTDRGCEILSHVPKEIEEIEGLRSAALFR